MGMLVLPYETERLRFELPDLTSEADLANHLAFVSENRVARMLAAVPHPYPSDGSSRAAMTLFKLSP